jgi:hypothetical protein
MHFGLLLRFVCASGMAVASIGGARAQESLSAAVREQIATLQAEKAARTPAQQKMDSQVLFLARKQSGQAFGAGLEVLAEKIQPPADGRELVDIKARSVPSCSTICAASAPRSCRACRVSMLSARACRSCRSKRSRRVPMSASSGRAVPALNNTGAKNSEGDKAHGADVVRAAFKATGLGVKVGVLSDSVDFLGQSQATGDLPAVTVLPGQDWLGAGLNGEGRRCLRSSTTWRRVRIFSLPLRLSAKRSSRRTFSICAPRAAT